ncbi:hypothetical protein E8E13_003749 [Curvularia kusanoi]|uniref:Heme haloperoxidase family profile domain-containing protein n=1 Tax=Curvularia kusanoi TaxID=90978 RepID=A0A9P4T4X4_CURKU|nr:hypothetical protein E8E13_003749 [Curvularia kusanoi]
MINALANHGHLPRNGRNVLASDMKAAMAEAGVSKALGALFVNTVYNVHQTKEDKSKINFLTRFWTTVRDPWTLLSAMGMRRPDQKDASGRPVLDLDQLALHGAIEHDVSLSRRDFAQKEGNCAPQADLIDDLLAASEDKKVITREELAALRRRRIETQREENSELTYGPLQHELGCGEIALILSVLGDGKKVPYNYVEAFFREERLPIEEGWKRRWWWTVGLFEVKMIVTKVKSLIGLEIK